VLGLKTEHDVEEQIKQIVSSSAWRR